MGENCDCRCVNRLCTKLTDVLLHFPSGPFTMRDGTYLSSSALGFYTKAISFRVEPCPVSKPSPPTITTVHASADGELDVSLTDSESGDLPYCTRRTATATSARGVQTTGTPTRTGIRITGLDFAQVRLILSEKANLTSCDNVGLFCVRGVCEHVLWKKKLSCALEEKRKALQLSLRLATVRCLWKPWMRNANCSERTRQ